MNVNYIEMNDPKLHLIFNIKIDVALTFVLSNDNKSLVISMFSFSMAKHNGVFLNKLIIISFKH